MESKYNMLKIKKLFIAPIRFYQKHISPNKGAPCCKYLPTCSEYAIEAIEEWGVIRRLALALWRVLRCNPFSKGGLDPVPQRTKKSRKTSKTGKKEKPSENEIDA